MIQLTQLSPSHEVLDTNDRAMCESTSHELETELFQIFFRNSACKYGFRKCMCERMLNCKRTAANKNVCVSLPY